MRCKSAKKILFAFALILASVLCFGNKGTPALLKVAVVNFKPKFNTPESNIKELISLNIDAINNGAKLIVNPELATSGFFWGWRETDTGKAQFRQGTLKTARETTQSIIQFFEMLAKSKAVYIVVGLPEVGELPDSVYNSAVMVGPEGFICKTRKKHVLPFFSEGNTRSTFKTPLGRITILICADAFYQDMTQRIKKADIIIVPMLHGSSKPNLQYPPPYLPNLVSQTSKPCIISNGATTGHSFVINAEGERTVQISKINSIGYANIQFFDDNFIKAIQMIESQRVEFDVR